MSVITSSRSAPPGPRHAVEHRRRHRGLLVFLAVVLILGGLSAAALNYIGNCKNGHGSHDRVSVTIPEGSSSGDVVNILHEAGVMRCGGLIGKFLMRNDDRAGSIRAGDYTLQTNMTVDQVLDVVTRKPKPVATIDILVPTGFRLTQIADRVEATRDLDIPAADFLAAARKVVLPPYLPKAKKNPEGFFYPWTYRIPVESATADSIVKAMTDKFRDSVADLPWKNAKKLGVSDYQVVTIASMIERETGLAADRPKIAAVIYNRLAKGMALGVDATLLYDDPTPDDGMLTSSDLKSDSPYNTRLHKGLPPTPIASPSTDSIAAALQPAHVDYLYYVLCPADGKGKSRFASTYDEFLHDKSVCLGN